MRKNNQGEPYTCPSLLSGEWIQARAQGGQTQEEAANLPVLRRQLRIRGDQSGQNPQRRIGERRELMERRELHREEALEIFTEDSSAGCS